MPSPDPHIVSITAGAAGMFCGSCMRDNALAAELMRRDVPITLVPAFTPIRTDEDDVSVDHVVMGGINVYLEHRWPVLGRLPRRLRALLDHPRLLRALERRSLQTRRDDDGEVALSLLRGERGRQAAEVEETIRFLEQLEPDVVSITNLLIAGFVPRLKERLALPVTVTLQGDDLFLEALAARDRPAVLEEMRRVAGHIDRFITFSDDYAGRMGELFAIPRERIVVVPLGLASPEEFGSVASVSEARPPTVGYLARLCPEKGLDRLVDAFLELRRLPGTEETRLRLAGWLGELDRPFVERQLARLRHGAGDDCFDLVDVPDRPAKAAFLHSVDVMSVPTAYEEPKGLFVLEALAAGVPVVQPAHGAFPEILEHTGGGVLVPPGDATALARALHDLLLDPAERRRLGEQGSAGLGARHTVEQMADATLGLWRTLSLAGRS